MPLLDDKIVAGKLLSLPKWKLENGEMVRRREFPNFHLGRDKSLPATILSSRSGMVRLQC